MERLLATANELIGRAVCAFDFFNLPTELLCAAVFKLSASYRK